jgi:3-dehydroquinate synthase
MTTIPVSLAGRPYEVRIASGLLGRLAQECWPRLRKAVVPIVTDAHVHALWGTRVEAGLAAGGHSAEWLVLEPGEQAKSWGGLARVVDWLLEQGVERGDHVLALGGGVVGDLTGFAAAVLKRGCQFIQLPTTLLAQVDSSVGGKTAINTPAGKNLVGAFHQPALVLADLDTLATLPARELGAGYAEVVKYGLIGDAEFFIWCEGHGAALLAGDQAAQAYAVAKSVAAKAAIVAEDEFETKGLRALLPDASTRTVIAHAPGGEHHTPSSIDRELEQLDAPPPHGKECSPCIHCNWWEFQYRVATSPQVEATADAEIVEAQRAILARKIQISSQVAQ